LKNALAQYGPWQEQHDLVVDMRWLKTALQEKIDSVDWHAAAVDVERFLKPSEVKSLELWSTRFFSSKLERLV
jgi:hypothetical protein